MVFNKILIVYSEKLTEKHKKAVDRVREIVGNRQCCIERADNLREELFRDVDLVITVGGDGSFIRAASFLRDTPIIGINSEPEISEGALLSLTESDLERLTEILEGNYGIGEMERIEVVLNGKLLTSLALNDVYVGSANQFHTSRYVVKFKEIEEEHRSSGVLITTAAGSTGWYKSAGQQPFSEKGKLKVLVREPFNRIVFQPKLIHTELVGGERIEFESKRHGGGVIAMDSNNVFDFNFGDRAEVRLSKIPLRVIL